MNPRSLIAPLRRATLVLALLMGIWLFWRFDRMRLPEAGCSPLAGVGAGDLLLVDRHPSRLDPGDAVFVEVEGRVHLARITERDGAGQLWLQTEVSSCPGADSDDFGWLHPDSVVGRVLLAWPW